MKLTTLEETVDTHGKLVLARFCVRALATDIERGKYTTDKDRNRASKALDRYKAELADLETKYKAEQVAA
jgi:hypothetical protein